MSLSPPDGLDPRAYRDIVLRALEEDLGGPLGAGRDVTTDATVPAIARARGLFIAKADCVVAGLDVAFECFRALDSAIQVSVSTGDGARCRAGDAIAEVSGSARTLPPVSAAASTAAMSTYNWIIVFLPINRLTD